MKITHQIMDFGYSAYSDVEWLGKRYNINFQGEHENEEELRENLMCEICMLDYEGIISLECCIERLPEFTTDQLVGLAIGSTLAEVMGEA